MARRTYESRWGFAKYDLALSVEDDVLVLHRGWRFVGFRARPPLVEVIEEGWLLRPAKLDRQ